MSHKIVFIYNMEDFENLLKRYFLFLEKHCLLSDSLRKNASESFSTIENLADQLQSASSIGPDIPINVQFPELKQKIIFKALTSLGQELVPIINTIQEFGNATEKLNKIAVSIENHNDANNFTVETISLGLLLESVHDSRQYYQAQYAGLRTALMCLDFRDNNSILKLRKCFLEDKHMKNHVQRCLLLGKHFLSAMNAEETS